MFSSKIIRKGITLLSEGSQFCLTLGDNVALFQNLIFVGHLLLFSCHLWVIVLLPKDPALNLPR